MPQNEGWLPGKAADYLRLRGPGWLGALLGTLNILVLLLTRDLDQRRDSEITRALAPSGESASASAVRDRPPPSPTPAGGNGGDGAGGGGGDDGRAPDNPPRSSLLPLAALCMAQLFSTSPLATFEALVTPFALHQYGFTSAHVRQLFSIRRNRSGSCRRSLVLPSLPSLLAAHLRGRSAGRDRAPQVGFLFAAASTSTLLVTAATPTVLRRSSARALLLVAVLVLGLTCLALAIPSPIAFVAMLLLFFAAYAASQAGLFCAFSERYQMHPQCAKLAGYISSAGSVGRCIGPPAFVALYNHSGDHAMTLVWIVNGGGALLGAVSVLAVWPWLAKETAPSEPRAAGAP